MSKKTANTFRQIITEEFPLDIELDRNDRGQHVIQIYKRVDDRKEPVTDVKRLVSYGYREEVETEDSYVIYRVSAQDRQTLLALLSMNPQIREDGTFVFGFAPSILSYLRQKNSVEESTESQQLTISEESLRPAARVDFEPAKGLTIQTGFQSENKADLIPAHALRPTADKKYVLQGNTFRPLPRKLSPSTVDWLRKGEFKVAKSDIPEFFQRDLVLLKRNFQAVLTDLASQIRVIDEPLKAVVKLDKGPGGWLDFDVGYVVGGVSLPHKLLAKSKSEPFIQLNDTTWVKNDPKTVEKTERYLKQFEVEVTTQGFRTPTSQFLSLEEFIESIGGQPQLSAAYREFLEQLTGFDADDTFRLSARVETRLDEIGITLRPYQRAGIHWLDWLYHNHLHGLLADDMGLGKTLQTICVLRHAYEDTDSHQPSMILAPRSVLHHWEREINRFFPEIHVYQYHGSGRRPELLHALEPTLFVSTYDTVAKDIEELSQVPFFYLILDEATRIKNPNAKRTQVTKALNAAHRLALSGTPVENRPTELWSVFDFLIRGHLGRYGTFVRLYEEKISAGDEGAAEQLGRRIKPFMLRRKKEEVARDLPEKIEMDEWCQLAEEQRQLYAGLQSEVRPIRSALQQREQVNYTAHILPVLTKLKQICDHPALVTGEWEPIDGRSEKFDWILEKVQEIHGNEEQVVVFSHFLGMLTLLQRALDHQGISHIRIDGSTTNRQALIDHFNAGQATVALCSIIATGYGINLTSANHVIHADRWWNPAVEDQATDRVHRIGQDKTVYVYRIMVEGTLEERIDTLLSNKRDVAEQIVGAATAGSHQWTRDELLAILQPLD